MAVKRTQSPLQVESPGSTSARRLFRELAARVPVLLLLGLTLLLALFEMGNFDIWWHLRTGQLIPERGVPTTDWFGFTSEGNTWIDVHWGFQVLMAWIHGRHGVAGMIIAKAIVAVVAMSLALLAYDRRWPVTVQVLVWIPALLLMSSRFYVRPETFTLLFTAAYLCILFHAEKQPGLLWLLPIIQVFWANFQGLFIFGPILLGMFFIEAIARMNVVKGLFRHLLPVSVLVAVACCLSPYRLGNVFFVIELWTRMRPEGQFFRENIAELQDLTTFWNQGGFGNEYVWILVFLLGLSAVSVVVAWKEILVHRRLFRLLPLVAFGWLSWQATRNGNHFAMVAGTIICWNFGSVCGQWQSRWSAPVLNGLLILGVGYFVLHGDWYERVGGHRRARLGIREGFESHNAMKFAGQEGMPDRAAIVHFGHAAVYIFHNGPDKKVLMDGRLEVHTQQEFEYFNKVKDYADAGKDWDSLLQAVKVDMLLVDSEHNHRMQAAVLQHPLWRCVYYDDVMAGFVRRGVPVPDGVNDFDFRHWLFDGHLALYQSPLPLPQPKPTWWGLPPDEVFPDRSDRLAERLYNVSLGLSQGTLGAASLHPVVLLCSQKYSQLAVRRRPWASETHRRLGAQLLALGLLVAGPGETPTVTDDWQHVQLVLLASAVECFQRAVLCNPGDYSSHFYLHDIYEKLQVSDKIHLHLQTLLTLPAENKTKIDLVTTLSQKLVELQTKLENSRKQIDPENLGFDGLLNHARLGLLERGMARIEPAIVKQLTAEQLDQIGVWYLLLGQANNARKVYSDAPQLDSNLRELRLGCCEQVLGNYEQARTHYLRILESDPNHQDVLLALALLNVLATDLHQCESYVSRLEASQLSPAQQKQVNWLRSLFPQHR